MSFWLGLTGGIGSGKTLVADELARVGAGVIDTDQISHQLTRAGGAAIPALQRVFGAGILTADGALDRVRMRQLVFSQPRTRQQLEWLLHPMILELASMNAAYLSHVLLISSLWFRCWLKPGIGYSVCTEYY